MTRRRLLNSSLLGAGVGVFVFWTAWLDASLARDAFATGYVLYGLVVFLAAYNLRKKLPGLPLGTSRLWMQAHAYLGAGSILVLAAHIGWRWPDGWLEGVLAASFAATWLSGVVGLYLTRTVPQQLARTSEQFVFERIPRLRSRVASDAQATVLAAVRATGATTLADLYANRLHGFFNRPRSLAYALSPTSAARKRLFNELTASRRLLTDAERTAAERLFTLIRLKDDLDFHAARQGLLKKWVFLHIALTWLLLTLGATHGLLALAFRGGPT
ncbi:hypothetical protein [Botrimarina hoheduenensis]|uniref:hypothetical protein n=1 Tax=Botrimarina hoheduenensis TaxID=2528000 RepID=UPI0011B424EF|nr:hypothetical protein [Botrimarina hoheduenensis]